MQSLGAIGDGITPNDALILSFVAIFFGVGAILECPSGNFLLNSTIALPSNCIIKGKGVDSTIFKYLPLNNRHIFGRLFFDYTSLLFTAIVKTITENNASSSKKKAPTQNDDYLTLGTYHGLSR
jgi:hypothetical protein